MSRIDQVVIHVQEVRGSNRTAEIAAATDNVRNADANEIVEWFSGNNSQTFIRSDRENIFFHPLPYGDFALGIINSWGNGGCSLRERIESFFVRVFIISPNVLLCYANNPIAIYENLRRENYIAEITTLPEKLKPITVLPEQKICDTDILKKLAAEAGAVAISRFFQSLLDSVSTIFRPYDSMTSLFVLSGIFNLLPVRFRSGLTFSTELFLSAVNPLQAIGFCGEVEAAVKLAKDSGVALVDFGRFNRYENPPRNVRLGQWSKLVLQILSGGDFAFWEYQIKADAELCNDPEEFVNWQDLDELAIIWQRKRRKKPINRKNCPNKTEESAERGIEKSIAAIEMLLADVKRKPTG
ncbi:MAG: hypothetical protein LBK06_05905 [Planctomycetaceae bacterium]|jgi:hypothetical protein|nr:hypothetical protein [Planctomycetaceae bacterium]